MVSKFGTYEKPKSNNEKNRSSNSKNVCDNIDFFLQQKFFLFYIRQL